MRSVLILAVFALALLVACAPAQPAAPAIPAVPAQPVAPVVPAQDDTVVETPLAPSEPVDEEPETLPTDKIVVTTEDLADSGKDCEDKAGSGTIDAQKEANECCTTKLGLPSVFTGGNCVPIS
jgi:hypothetical protein